MTNTGLTGDDQTVAVTLPFGVTFFGSSFSAINVSSNGNAHFGTADTAYSNVAIPNTGAPNGMIAPFWDDLYLPSGGAVYTGISGTAPNRVFAIEWRNVPHFSGTSDGATFEIQIEESSNHIWFLYQDTSFANASYDSGVSATSGIENAAGSAGSQYSFNTAALTNNKVVHFWPAIVAPTSTATAMATSGPSATPTRTATATTGPTFTPTRTPTVTPTPILSNLALNKPAMASAACNTMRPRRRRSTEAGRVATATNGATTPAPASGGGWIWGRRMA